jgi:hypothetical protein
MAFDISTARPAEQPLEQPSSTGFDISTAQPIKEQETGFLGEVKGGLETGAAILSGAVAEPLSGLSGLVVSPVATPRETTQVIEKTADALTYDPVTPEGRRNLQAISKTLKPVGELLEKAEKASGDLGFDLAGPVGGALASSLPAALLELLGIATLKKVAKSGAAVEAVAEKAESVQSVADQIKTGNAEAVAEAVNPNPEIVAAAEELQVNLPAGATSQNQAFIEAEQSLKSRPGSTISAVEQQAIIDIGDRADALISDIGGTTDRALLDTKVKDDFLAVTEDMSGQSSDLYRAVQDAINPSTRVDVENVRQYLDDKLIDLGGDASLLTKAEQQLKTLADNDALPTYAALDRVRRNVGEGFRRRGVFADDEIGTLESVYGALSKDQSAAAATYGVGDKLKQAQKLVSDRKGLEKRMAALYGKDLQGSFISKISSSTTGLTKGDVAQFKKLMQAVPDGLKGEVAASVLNDVFMSGTRNKAALGGGFVKAYEGLKRNPSAKAELFKHLPKGSQRRFDLIGSVATGLYKSKALENTSKTARDVIAAMDQGGLFSKIYSAASRAGAAEAVSSSVGLPGVGASSALTAALVKPKTAATAAADALLTSPKFSSAVKAAAEGKRPVIENSSEYRKWYKYASKRDRDDIGRLGFMGWLIASDQITGQETE